MDPSGKAPGRGAYIHANQECWAAAMKGSLEHALNVQLIEEERKKLEQAMKKKFDEQND